jgi:hypothetical protein
VRRNVAECLPKRTVPTFTPSGKGDGGFHRPTRQANCLHLRKAEPSKHRGAARLRQHQKDMPVGKAALLELVFFKLAVQCGQANLQ